MLVFFLAINRHAVTIDFWPFDYAPKIRLFVAFMVILGIDVLWGGLAAWLAGRGGRRRGRESNRHINSLKKELCQAQARIKHMESGLSVGHTVNRSASSPPLDVE